MKYKLIAIDLDGTLLDDEKKIPTENIKVISDLIDIGVEVVIATGRGYMSAKNLVLPLKRKLTIVANNGTIIREMKDDRVLIKKYLNVDDFRLLLVEGRKRGLHPVLHVDHYEEGYDLMFELEKDDLNYTTYLSKVTDRYIKMDDLLDYKNPRILSIVYISEIEALRDFQALLLDNYSNKFNTHILDNLTKVGPILEIMHPRGSKWLSLLEYAKEKNINSDEIISIGDDTNDIEMIKKAGLGIGMKNCSYRVKETADIIINRTNNEAGVAYILSEIFNL